METAHLIGGIAVLATNLVAGAWGAVAWLRQVPSVAFWTLLRIAQAAVVAQVLLGAVLLLSGRESAEAIRAGAAERELVGVDFDSLPRERQRLIALAIVRRETGIMAASALIVLFLALRAAGTSGELF